MIKLYKKFSYYMLENYPLAWHTKLLQMLVAGLLMWTIAYYSGYFLVDNEVLQNHILARYYTNSYFSFFHFILVGLTIIVWAVYFFKNNAFKSFYPLSRTYFMRLFLHLFLPFFLLITAYYPFTKGAYSKTKTLFDKEELKKDIRTLNLGAAFLVTNTYQYDFTNRVYPSPYPIETSYFDENIDKWQNYGYHIKTEGTYKLYHPSNYSQHTVEVDGLKRQFFKVTYKYIDANKCEKKNVITRFYSLSALNDLQMNGILNYSELLIRNNFVDEYKTNYAPIVHAWIKNKKYNAIRTSIDEFEKVCEKYNIKHRLNSKHILRYLIYKDFKNFNATITESGEDTYTNYSPEDEMNQIEATLRKKKETLKYMATQHCYFFNRYDMENLIDNFQMTEKSNFVGNEIFGFFMGAFFMVWFFFFFEFTSFKDFFISVAVTGIMAIVVGLSVAYIDHKTTVDDEILAFSMILGLFIVVISVTVVGLKMRWMSKKLLSIFVNLSYIAMPFFLMVAILLYSEITKHKMIYDRCIGGYRSEIEYSSLLDPGVLFLTFVLGILPFFQILKKWKAKPE